MLGPREQYGGGRETFDESPLHRREIVETVEHDWRLEIGDRRLNIEVGFSYELVLREPLAIGRVPGNQLSEFLGCAGCLAERFRCDRGLFEILECLTQRRGEAAGVANGEKVAVRGK